MKAALFWSGGKDAAFALYKIQNDHPDIEIKYLVTTINKEYRRVSMHGIREEVLERQAEALKIPLYKILVPNIPDNQTYENELKRTLIDLKHQGIDTIVFGDILLEDLRIYREKQLQAAGLKGCFPLWKMDTKILAEEILSSGFKTLACCINDTLLNEGWAGREMNRTFIEELPENVDPCGENGEFHTFCYDGPIFKKAVSYTLGRKEFHPIVIKMENEEMKGGFWYIDLL